MDRTADSGSADMGSIPVGGTKNYLAMKTIRRIYPLLFLFALLLSNGSSFGAVPEISVIADPGMGRVAMHGMEKLTETLRAMNIPFEQVASPSAAGGRTLLVAGLSEGEGAAATLLKTGGCEVPRTSEALTVWNTRWQNKPATVVAGYDERGLMYALLDIALRISWSDGRTPMKFVKEVTSEPYVKERGIAMYTMHRRYWESRFYDEEFWADYFDMMARDRLNMLEILFGYENGGFMAPCYPYFFDVDGYPEVKMEDITAEQQKRNVEAMHRLIAMAHDRGIGVRLGVWDHIYRGGVQAGGNSDFEYDPDHSLPWQVTGLETTGNLIPYTKAAFAKLLGTFPELDAILFKTNNESGLKTSELHDFSVSFFETVAETAPGMQIDIHSKGLTDTLINTAISRGIKFRIAPKFWMEQLGLPFSPTHVNREDQRNRRHGYADMLRYPQHYEILWKLWNGGTNRAFLWGDPEYVRRFAAGSHLYNSSAYEVYEPMATKMETQFHDVEPFDLLKSQYQYYDQEYERYWYFFQLWGLVGYDPQTSTDVWDKEFERRFGVKAAPVVQSALNEASWVLPRIIASCYPYSFFPTTSAWPEKQRLGDLPLYAKAEGSDIQQFASFDQEAQVLLGILETGKTLPSTTSLWLRSLSESIDKKVAEAERKIGTEDNKEFNSTMVDLKMLSRLALYHSRRVPAAVSYCLFLRTGDVAALDAAIAHEQNAADAWRELVEAAGDVYADDIQIGRVPLSGHWRDELAWLDEGLVKLREQRANYTPAGTVTPAPLYKTAPATDNGRYFSISHTPVETAPAGQSVTVRIKVTAPAGVKWAHLQYRAMNQYLDFTMLPMTPTAEKNVYEATVPADKINTVYDLMYLIEVMDNKGRGYIYPDLNKETPYVIVHFER